MPGMIDIKIAEHKQLYLPCRHLPSVQRYPQIAKTPLATTSASLSLSKTRLQGQKCLLQRCIEEEKETKSRVPMRWLEEKDKVMMLVMMMMLLRDKKNAPPRKTLACGPIPLRSFFRQKQTRRLRPP